MPKAKTSSEFIPPPPSLLTNENLGEKFLLADFELLKSFKEQSVLIGDKRVDLFLTLFSGFIAGVGLLSQTNVDQRNLTIIGGIGAFALLAIGIAIFIQVIDRDIIIVDYIRAINRVRAYFVQLAPNIRDYILMPTSHHYPKYTWQSSNRFILIVINSLSFSGCIVLGIMIWGNNFVIGVSSFISAGICLIVAFIVQSLYAFLRFQTAEKMAQDGQTVTLAQEKELRKKSIKAH